MDLIFDFTHTYPADWIEENKELEVVDCSDIEGTDMYCTPEAEAELERRAARFPLGGIHFIDSGNYHYMTRLFTKRIREPYNLVFFDNHSDMQPTMILELLSCGAWAKQTVEEDENLKRLILIGPDEKTISGIDVANSHKLVCISRMELCEHEKLRKRLAERLSVVDMSLPLYVSVDKDVMGEKYARTNWDQGDMSLETLKEILKILFGGAYQGGGGIVAVDICGELPQKDARFMEAAEAEQINRSTNQALYDFIKCSSVFRTGTV